MFKLLTWQKYVLVFTTIILFCLVASYDIDQAEQSHALYCENVKDGVWPDYKKSEPDYDESIDCDYQQSEGL